MKSECLACGEKFGGMTLFEAHRSGKFTDNGPDYGRRCLSQDEMTGKGWTQRNGMWHGKSPDNNWWNKTGEGNG